MKQKTKKRTVQFFSILLAALMLLGVGWTGVSAWLSARQEAMYPPMLCYGGEFYQMTGEQLDALPEGEAVTVDATVVGDQRTIPLSDSSCNFGEETVTFQLVGGTAYWDSGEGWMACEKIDLEDAS